MGWQIRWIDLGLESETAMGCEMYDAWQETFTEADSYDERGRTEPAPSDGPGDRDPVPHGFEPAGPWEPYAAGRTWVRWRRPLKSEPVVASSVTS